MDKTPHAVCVPFPVQGHVIPFMKLDKILHSRGFYVTFVNTEYNHRRLIQSQGPDFEKSFQDFKFETIPEGLPPSDHHATQDPVLLCDSIRKNCLSPFRDLLSKLISSPFIPPISCIISDGMMSFAIKAAQEFGILDVQFWTASACGYMGYLQFDELRRRGIVPFKGPNFVKGFQDFQFETIPEGLPPSDRDVTQDPASLCDSIRKNCLTHFWDLLSKLISSPVISPISCIISDGMMSFAIKAAQEFGILDVQFWTASACGYMGYLQYDELRRREIIPFK
ncbi:hypothetical protein MTR67_013094, partial [Solanum verrucosum]